MAAISNPLVLGLHLRFHPMAHVSCQTYVTMGMLIVGGEITTQLDGLSLRWYVNVITYPQFQRAAWNSLLVTAGAVALAEQLVETA